ncbi:MAG: hypothetical protein V9G16_08345 [Nitrosomonas sp.]
MNHQSNLRLSVSHRAMALIIPHSLRLAMGFINRQISVLLGNPVIELCG